jgi:hypothetical protein
MRSGSIFISLLITVGCISGALSQGRGSDDLQPPSAFANITDEQARSRALFSEVAKVLTNPRCINCHPADDRPTQGNDMHPHLPPVYRAVGTCQTCHTQENYRLHEGASYQSIPGHPRWDMAPLSMAWQGKSQSEICQQLRDPNRNGGRNLELLFDHVAHDDLVAWAWQPGEGRQSAPGSQRELGDLVRAWIDTGAACP